MGTEDILLKLGNLVNVEATGTARKILVGGFYVAVSAVVIGATSRIWGRKNAIPGV
jgi:hypothetical protein